VRLINIFSPAGFSVLPDELCAAKEKKEQEASKESESSDHPPMVSEEDISVGYSTFQDCLPKTEGDSPAAALSPQMHQEPVQQDFSGKTQDQQEY
jgi:ankyrin